MGRHRWHRERHQQEWYLRYVTCCVFTLCNLLCTFENCLTFYLTECTVQRYNTFVFYTCVLRINVTKNKLYWCHGYLLYNNLLSTSFWYSYGFTRLCCHCQPGNGDVEQRALATSPVKPFFWKRYVDDVISAVFGIEAERLLSHFNSVEPSIQSTLERDIFHWSVCISEALKLFHCTADHLIVFRSFFLPPLVASGVVSPRRCRNISQSFKKRKESSLHHDKLWFMAYDYHFMRPTLIKTLRGTWVVLKPDQRIFMWLVFQNQVRL